MVVLSVCEISDEFVSLIFASSDHFSEEFGDVLVLLFFIINVAHVIGDASYRDIVLSFSFELKNDVGVHTPETCRKLEVLVNEIAPIVFLSERISNFALKLSIARLGSSNRFLGFELDWRVPENVHLLLKNLKRFHLFRRILL